MIKDTLFTLAPGFEDGDRREYCPECAEVAGLLAYFPAIKDALNIVHVSLSHPRKDITALLGDGNYNAPTLVLGEGSTPPDGVRAKSLNGRLYLDSASGIAALWRARYGTPARRGD